jgi:hypothetical protein
MLPLLRILTAVKQLAKRRIIEDLLVRTERLVEDLFAGCATKSSLGAPPSWFLPSAR